MDQYETWHAGRHRPWPHCVRWGPISLPQKGRSPQFSVHVYCGQMSGWIKMPLGREVGLSPGYIVLDGDPAPSPPKPGGTPNFRPCLLWPNGWMDNDATSYGSRPQPRPHCVRRGPSSRPRERGTAASPTLFGPCLLWPRSPISATAELLFIFGTHHMSLERVKLKSSNFLCRLIMVTTIVCTIDLLSSL